MYRLGPARPRRSSAEDRGRQRDIPPWPPAERDIEHQGEFAAEGRGTGDGVDVGRGENRPVGDSDVQSVGQIDHIGSTANIAWLKTGPVKRDVQVGLERRHDG